MSTSLSKSPTLVSARASLTSGSVELSAVGWLSDVSLAAVTTDSGSRAMGSVAWSVGSGLAATVSADTAVVTGGVDGSVAACPAVLIVKQGPGVVRRCCGLKSGELGVVAIFLMGFLQGTD